MRMPTQSQPADRSMSSFAGAAAWSEPGVAPQLSLCTPCVQVGGGRKCFTLPFFGNKCFNIPNFGRWKACCKTRWGIPPVTCGISRC